MKRPSFTNLETICCIARLGTFVAAAEALRTTQPAISARVQELERTLGIKLFQRRGRRLELTVQGRDFVERAEPVLHQVEDLFLPLDDPAAASGHVRLGTGHVAMSWLPQLIVRLRREMPRLSYELKVDIAPGLLRDLDAGSLDLAIIPGQITNPRLNTVELGYADMAWMTSSRLLPRPGEGRFDLADFLKRHQIWCVPRESFMHGRMLEFLERQGVSGRNISYCNDIMATIEMILNGSGVGLLPEALVREQVDRGSLVKLPGMAIRSLALGFSIAWYRGERQAILSRIIEAAIETSTFRRAE